MRLNSNEDFLPFVGTKKLMRQRAFHSIVSILCLEAAQTFSNLNDTVFRFHKPHASAIFKDMYELTFTKEP